MIKKFLFAVASCLTLSACGSGGVNPIVKDSLQRLNPFEGSEETTAPATRRQALTRAAVEKSGIAVIRASLLTEESKFLFYGASANKGYVTFATRSLQQITLRGARITGTRGLGADLLASQTNGPDPVVTPVPPQNWPSSITRIYTLPGGSKPQGQKMVFNCSIEQEGPASLVIVGRRHEGVQFSETCHGDGISFENLYLADRNSGFVWRSIQWIGPELGNVDLEIVEPYTP